MMMMMTLTPTVSVRAAEVGLDVRGDADPRQCPATRGDDIVTPVTHRHRTHMLHSGYYCYYYYYYYYYDRDDDDGCINIIFKC